MNASFILLEDHHRAPELKFSAQAKEKLPHFCLGTLCDGALLKNLNSIMRSEKEICPRTSAKRYQRVSFPYFVSLFSHPRICSSMRPNSPLHREVDGKLETEGESVRGVSNGIERSEELTAW
jgi:hypothetical protein